MFLTLTVSANAWAAEGIYKTALFGASYNSKKISSYTDSWSATNDGFTVNLTNANNNSNGWNYIKMGRKDYASTGTITTAAAIDKAVTKVTLTIDAITSNNVTSITLKSASTLDGTYTEVGTFTKSTGTQTITISSPKINLFFKIEVVCKSGSSNGLITISRVDYYADLTPAATYDVSWVVNGEEIDVTKDISEGSKVPSLPAEPEIDCSGKVFVGWSNQEVLDGENPAVLFRDVANSPTITKQTTFYAVFAESGGSSVTTWSKTDISAINDGDEVVVVMNNGKNYALYDANGTGSAPTATLINVSNNLIASPSEGIVWVIGKSGNDLTFYKDDTKKTWLYCTATNNGVRVGTNTNKTFTIDTSSGYLKHTATSRYVGIYNSQDWRCYDNTTGNIKGQTLAFYKKTTTAGYQNYTTSCTTPSEYTVTFNANGHGTAPTPQTVASGQQATEPTPAPTATGYTFGGWYKESECTNEFDFSTSIIDNITLYAQWTCETPVFDIKIKEDNPVVFSGELIELTVVGSNIAADATYQWYKYNGTTYDELTGQKANKLTIAEATANDAGNYKCVVTNGTCSGENNYTVKMYHIKGLTDNAWTTPFEFEKSGDKEGTFTIELAATTTYYFKLNDGSVWYWNEGTMTHNNCTDWVIEQEGADTQGKANTGITTTASGTYTFTLNYEDPSKPKLSVTYPQKKMVYFNPNMWDADGDTEVYTVYSWQEGSNGSFVTMTSVEGCGNTNIYQAEIDASHNKLLFIRWNQAHTAWDNNRWNQSIDLDYQTNGQYKIDDWGNNSDLYWKNGAKKSWASYEKTFTPNYTVSFDANGHGTPPEDQCITDGDKATNPGNLSTTGYTFGGWYKEAGCNNAWDFANDVVTSDITLYAKWTINTHTVTWKPAGGNWSGVASDIVQEYEYGAVIEAPDKPTYDCHEFVEWNPVYTVGKTMPDEDLVFTATWNKLSYTITFKNYDGAVLQTSTVECGETPSYTGATPTREQTAQYTYTFKDWSPTIAPATKDQVYTAQFDEVTRSYTVTWMVGTTECTAGTPTNQVEYDKKVTNLPTSPQDDAIGTCANKFTGWSTKSSGSNAENADYYDDLFTTAENSPAITDATTFYAVFATAEETGGGTVEATLSFANTAQRTSWSTSQQVWEQNGVTFTHDKANGDNIVNNYSPIRCYKNSKITITHTSNEITKIVFDCNTNAYATDLQSSIGTIDGVAVSKSSDKVTVSFTNAVTSFAVTLSSGQVRLDGITVTAGGGTITTYSNYVTNCCALARATNLTVSGTTANSATLTWTAPSPTTGITKLQVRDENGNVKVDNLAADATTATITGLSECAEYTFCIASVGDECELTSQAITVQPFSGAKTVNYNYNGGTGSPASFTTSCENQKIVLPDATRPGYTFNGWFDAESGGNRAGGAGEEYDPTTSPVTLYAQWTEDSYTLTHSGDNYTNTENKTTIKSSETPLTLNYTCTADYGFPATISITGGGKSWTVNTDYTWEVAVDKQSATLTINQTTISANVTITINMATRYTVSFEHHDKGAFDGESSIEVLSSENTITLPTIEDVSCGFYDTFEGWIVSNSEYVESTTKPATIYAGGASYKVTGDCTFRALYSKCEGDATQVYRKVTTTGDVTDGTYILVANTATPLVYSGHTDGKDYGDCISGLTADGSDFSNSLPDGAVPVMVSVGVSGFSIHNGTKFIVAGTSTGVSDNASYWQLTDGSQVNSKTCPLGVLQPVNNTTYVLQKNNTYDRFKTYENSQSAYVFLYKLIDKCTKYYSTNPSCEKPVGVHIVYNANAVDASMSCSTQDRTYKVENEVNKYPQLASQLQFCTNATREGYTLVGWNTQSNGQGTTYNINQNYYNLPVSGELDGEKWITLNLYAMWKPCIKFNLGNATGGTGVPDAVVENGECVLPEPTAEQLGTIPCGYEFYAWSETSITPTQTKPALFMPGDTYTGSALTLYAVYRWCEGNTGSDTYYFTFNVNSKTYCITQKHNSYARFVVEEATKGLVFGLENGYLYYLDENGTKNYVYYEGNSTYVTTTTTYPNADTQKTTFVEGDNGTTIVTPAILGRYLQMPSSYTDRAYYTTDGINPTLVEVQTTTCTYTTNPTCYTNTNLHFVTNGGTLNYPTDYDETDYQELAPGSTVFLPTATFAGEWTFEGWKRGSQLESQTVKPDDPSFYSVTLNTTQFEVDDVGDIYFYAVYSKTNDDKQFDPVNGGTYKLFAIGADGTKTYMPVWTGTRGTPSGVTTCAETGDYTITPGTGTHAGQYQITCGEYTLGVVSGNTDLNEVEGTWWNIEPSTSGKGTWRITVVGSTDDRALSCSFSVAKSFGNYAISNLNSPTQTVYRDMEIGECIYTEYTSTPENIPYITITGAPVKITSTNGERIYAPTTLHIEAHNFTGERIIHLSATNGFGVDPVQVRTNGQGAYSGDVKVYYEPTTDGDGQTITTSVLTASQTGGTNAEKINQTFAAIQGRNMPANFVIAAKWDGHWYALPANCTSSLSPTEGLLIEVNDMDNPTTATAAPASAKYGLREVIPSRQTDYGQGVVFTERFAKDDKQFALYNGSNANIQVNAQYSNYAASNPAKYEWIPTTSDFNEYTVTNASTGRNLGLTSGSFGAYTAASNRVYLLPATFYEPAPVQVLKWKANSVIVMYTGAETTATTQIGNNAASDKQTLADQKITHGIYELTTKQALTSNAGGALKLNFGENTRVELEIPLIISGDVTASANAHDVVILENSKLTAATTKYSYKDVYVYGGGKLAIPDGTTLGVNNIILRAGSVATDGAGQNAIYQYIYPQVELKGTLTSSVQNIRYEYVTDYDHWYHLALPFDGSLASIHYPYEYYGDQVKLDNTGSWQIKRYAGEIRATGNYDAWKDIEEDEPKATTVTAGKGYIYWGAPKKITANDVYDRPTWGIQRITMSVSAPDAKTAENGNKTIAGLGSYESVPNNSGKDNDQGWNLIGNPYMVNLTGLNSQSLQIGQLIHETDASGNWTGKWHWDDTSEQTGLRYVTIPSDHFDTYTAGKMTETELVAGRSFFVQIAGDATDLVFDVNKKASLMPALLAENSDKPVDIETGIVLSNETLQDEVNFWIKDGKTNDYEYNADYPKTPNNNHFNIYGVHTNGDLSWVATGPEYAAESMPIGYQVPAAGTYTLSVSETYYSEDLQALYVTDHAMSPELTVDLMNAPYEFSVNQAETNNERFTISLILKSENQGPTTGWENIDVGKDQSIKFIYLDQLYILRNGIIYDATGQQIKTINK